MILGKKDGWKVILERNKPGPEMSGTFSMPNHQQNFFDCIRNGNRPNADIEIGHLTASLCHLGNIATRVGRLLHFEPDTENFVDDPEAARMLRREYRPGHWAAPKDV
jgi:hypothetical protein